MFKNLILILVCASCSESLLGNDFRVLDFGDLCENIAEQELKIGGKQVGSGALNGFKGSFDYHGVTIADEALILYTCSKDNIFISGSVVLVKDSEEEAAEKAFEILETIVNIHGPPNISKDFTEEYPGLGVTFIWGLSAYEIMINGSSNTIYLSFRPNIK
jgi:hypothetical protein